MAKLTKIVPPRAVYNLELSEQELAALKFLLGSGIIYKGLKDLGLKSLWIELDKGYKVVSFPFRFKTMADVEEG